MAVRDDFAAGEVLSAADLNDTFAEKLPYSYGTATPSTTIDGFLWYDENDTPPTPKFWDGAAFQALTSGKILQIVRATDSTERTTTSTSFVDANLSVTITPTKSTSAIIVIWAHLSSPENASQIRQVDRITDSSNNAISGAEQATVGFQGDDTYNDYVTMVGYDTPASTSAVTYKARFRWNGSSGGNARHSNNVNTGHMIAIEVAA